MLSTLDKGSRQTPSGTQGGLSSVIYPAGPDRIWKESITQILGAIAGSSKHIWNRLKGRWERKDIVWQCDQLRFVSILRNVSLQIFTGVKVDSFSPLCTRFKLELAPLWTSSYISPLNLKQIDPFFIGWGYRRSVSEMSIALNLLLSSVPTESHLGSCYCSQFISIENIDHLLDN